MPNKHSKPVPRGPVFSDGKGGSLTPAQWKALTPEQRAEIQKLVDEQIEALKRVGTI